jgi:hypothetical protein
MCFFLESHEVKFYISSPQSVQLSTALVIDSPAEKIIRNLFFQVPLIQRKMQLYLANRETEFILFRWPTGFFLFFILMKADYKCRHCWELLPCLQAYSVQLDEHVSGASLHAEERVLHWPADSGRLSISGLIVWYSDSLIDDYKLS